MSDAENKRRNASLLADLDRDKRHTSAVVTTQEIRLTKSAPCRIARASIALSDQWGWTIRTLSADSGEYFQSYGIIRHGELDTSFHDDNVPIDFLSTRGQLNAAVVGTLTTTTQIPGD